MLAYFLLKMFVVKIQHYRKQICGIICIEWQWRFIVHSIHGLTDCHLQ